ncbi:MULTISPECIES: transcriptional regulator [Haloferax]|uniref:Transcriptional regulator n=1 Tax=Haloferax marinum TaxID=2666143 RepID=A0A6A8GC39_9EURY|nr:MULTISPECIES: transcriptional regulator [Haloferax]KAB1190710.1 transcriptional regulator [Haloferax sp. CBA1150]MRW98242.1 transcriptional regulator [Haloferax marinum]
MAAETMANKPMVCEATASDVFEALANRYRRQLLVTLAVMNPQQDETLDPFELVDGTTEGDDSDATHVALFHVHLPKLSNHGFIDWDEETGELCTGTAWGEIEPVVDVLQENRDELPDGLV